MNVLDSSVLLAMILREPGWEEAEDWLEGSLLLTVNYLEVYQRLLALGRPSEEIAELLSELVFGVVPLDLTTARTAAELVPHTSRRGLSLGDRCCLALAKQMGGVAVTADRMWSGLRLDIPVHLIR